MIVSGAGVVRLAVVVEREVALGSSNSSSSLCALRRHAVRAVAPLSVGCVVGSGGAPWLVVIGIRARVVCDALIDERKVALGTGISSCVVPVACAIVAPAIDRRACATCGSTSPPRNLAAEAFDS